MQSELACENDSNGDLEKIGTNAFALKQFFGRDLQGGAQNSQEGGGCPPPHPPLKKTWEGT